MKQKSLYDILLERGFTQTEINQFLKAKENGLDIPRNVSNVDVIRDYRRYCLQAKCESSRPKQKLILNGVLNNLEVHKYAKPEYELQYMREVFIGLSNGVDITDYCKHTDSYYYVENARLALMNGVTNKEALEYLKVAANKYRNADIIEEIRFCLEKSINLDDIKKCKDSRAELRKLRKKS